MKTSPTARSLQWLREQGALAEKVEYWNPFSHTSKDLFGWIDIVAIMPNTLGVTGIQVTTTGHMNERIKKILASDTYLPWVQARNSVLVMGWAKQGPRGKRKTWTLKMEWVRGNNHEPK